MKTARGPGNVTLVDVEEPSCGPSMVKVEVHHCGICGTDLHVLHDTFPNHPPVILGHEFAGIVVDVGSGVKRFRTGDRVVVLGSTAVTCGRCLACRTGDYMFCDVRRGMGHGVNGGLTRFVAVREDQLYPVPAGVELDEAAMAEPFASAVQAVTELGDARLGDVALVSGPGPIGIMCLKLLVGAGVRTIVAGPPADAARLAMASRLGAYAAVDVSTQSLDEVVRDASDGRGADVVFEAAGAAPSIDACLGSVRKQGRFVQVGICGGRTDVDFDRILYKQLTVQGSVGHSLRTWDRVMRILAQRTVRLDDLITHRFALSSWREAFDVCVRKEGMKVLLHPGETT